MKKFKTRFSFRNCIYRRILCQTNVIVKKDETIQNITRKVHELEEFSAKLPPSNVKEELMMTRVRKIHFKGFG